MENYAHTQNNLCIHFYFEEYLEAKRARKSKPKKKPRKKHVRLAKNAKSFENRMNVANHSIPFRCAHRDENNSENNFVHSLVRSLTLAPRLLHETASPWKT